MACSHVSRNAQSKVPTRLPTSGSGFTTISLQTGRVRISGLDWEESYLLAANRERIVSPCGLEPLTHGLGNSGNAIETSPVRAYTARLMPFQLLNSRTKITKKLAATFKRRFGSSSRNGTRCARQTLAAGIGDLMSQVVPTTPGERIMQPDYGSRLTVDPTREETNETDFEIVAG